MNTTTADQLILKELANGYHDNWSMDATRLTIGYQTSCPMDTLIADQ